MQVDPGLLLLPRLRAAGQKFSLLAQLLSEELPSHGQQQGRRESGPSSSSSGSSKSGESSNEMDGSGSGEGHDGTHALARLFCKPPPVTAADASADADGSTTNSVTGNEGAGASETSPPNDVIALGLERLCDVKDLDDLGVFYRLNETKVEAWLKGKVPVFAPNICFVNVFLLSIEPPFLPFFLIIILFMCCFGPLDSNSVLFILPCLSLSPS